MPPGGGSVTPAPSIATLKNALFNYNNLTDKIGKFDDNDFIIIKTEIEKEFPNLFINANDIPEILPPSKV